MPSFDIVSKVDIQTLDNSINVARKEILNRYDFRGSDTSIELDKKGNVIQIATDNSMQMNSIIDVIIARMAKQGLEGRSLDLSKEEYQSGQILKKEVPVKTGIDKETAKKIIKIIKDSKLKVTPAIMDDMVRVTAKKIDDLQEVIALLRRSAMEIPLQFINMK